MKKVGRNRILLKLSGEALADHDHLVSHPILESIAVDIAAVMKHGKQLAMVVGGGNILRGKDAKAAGLEHSDADMMGMLATVINSLYVASVLRAHGLGVRVMSAIAMPPVCESYVVARALNYLRRSDIVIVAGGTSNPFFTTDSAAALRAIEMKCDILYKATKVDGVYDKDPMTNDDAKRYEHLSYEEVLKKDLKVMDGVAIALAREHNLPIMIGKMEGGLKNLLQDGGICTTIGKEREHD